MIDNLTRYRFELALEEQIQKEGFRITDEKNPYAIGANRFRQGARWALEFLRQTNEIAL